MIALRAKSSSQVSSLFVIIYPFHLKGTQLDAFQVEGVYTPAWSKIEMMNWLSLGGVVRIRASVFCHNGLGDGVNCLVLSNHLHLNGWKVDTYQNMMGGMQRWFPHLPIQPYPSLAELPIILGSYDWFFVIHNDTDEFVLQLIREGKRRFPEQLKVIYLYPSKHVVNEPYYSDCLTEPHLSIAENLRLFCARILRLPKITKSNGFIPPPGLAQAKYSKRVVIHPTSARITRNWPKEKFVKLALHLQKKGYLPAFIPGVGQEREQWQEMMHDGWELPSFSTLDELACFIYESGYLIGNDSGPGHLASALGTPTLTLCRRKTWANMWAPSFCNGIVVTPYSWLPNIRGFRFRDRYWKSLISVGRVCRAFETLVKRS